MSTTKTKVIIAKTQTGKLLGLTKINQNGEQFYSFQGIPYAAPPIGPLRFKAPLPATPWERIKDATHESHDCYHRASFSYMIQGDEDCLTLNIYTRNLLEENSSKKPVMVWLHGGGFSAGSGSTEIYGPEFLMTEDIVLVAVNYRLGILGFLCLEDPTLDVPGNAGLKDIVLALKWVQQNISNFCGDPNNVTLFGESAGAAAAHFMVLSPLAKNLFHKVILQSGCALNVWTKGRCCSKELAELLELKTVDERKILEKLQSLTVDELYKLSLKITDKVFVPCKFRPYAPVVEKHSKNAFITEEPLTILTSGKYNHVPMIIGYTSREGKLAEFLNPTNDDRFEIFKDFELSVPNFLKLERGSDISKAIAKDIKNFYYGDTEFLLNNTEPFILLYTDNFFLREIIQSIRLHTSTSECPIYFYRMTIETNLNMAKKFLNSKTPGVCHADDLGYLFKNAVTPENIEPGSDEDKGWRTFVTLWTNFARSSNPNHGIRRLDIYWNPVNKQNLHFLDIGNVLAAGVNPEKERMEFWDKTLNGIRPRHHL